MKPRIGITIDSFDPVQDQDAKHYSNFYWYAMKQQCIVAVAKSGGLPILLPHHTELIEDYQLDGLLISGGAFDVPPLYYNEKINPKTRLKPRRSEFERHITELFIERKKPILGICGGMQLLVALYGGKLYQSIEEENAYQNHNQPSSPFEAFHDITYVKGTKLWSLIGEPSVPISVNSVHRQGIKDPGTLTVNAYAEDALIEGVEDQSHPFCIGLQWHPEFFVNDYDVKILMEFINHAKKHKAH